MKKLISSLVILLVIGGCSFHSRQTTHETNRSEPGDNVDRTTEAVNDNGVIEKANAEDIQPALVKQSTAEVDKILNKKINPNTFDADMKVIEGSKLFDPLTCQSLRYSYNLVRQYSSNSWDVTYKRALESASEGSKSARRIENIPGYKRD